MSSAIGGFLGGLGGGSIGRATVALALDDSRYQAQLAGDEEKTAAATGGMAKTTSGASAGMTAAYAAAGLAAAEFAKSSVEAAIEQQIATDKLNNSVVNSSKVSFESIDAFNEQANSIRNLTGVSDESVTTSQALQVQMGLTADQVKQLTPLIVDLSVKQGIDLQTATKAVGKAVNGSSGALGRLGVVIDKTAFAGDHYGTVLKGLTAAQGFAADKANAEPWVKLEAQFHELEETVGKGLLPVIQELAGGLDLLTQGKLPSATTALTGLQIGAKLFGANIPVLGAAIRSASEDSAGFKTDLDALQKQIDDGSVSVLDAADKVYQLARAHGYSDTKAKELASSTAGLYHQEIIAASSTAHLAEVSRTAAAAARAQKLAEDQLAGGMLGLISSLESLRQDQVEVNRLKKEGKTGTDAYAQAVEHELQDQLSYSSAIKDLAKQMHTAGASTAEVKAKVFELGHEAGLSRPDIIALFNSVSSGANNAHDNITSVKDAIRAMRHEARIPITIPIHVQLSSAVTAGALTPAQLQELALALRNRLADSSRSNAGHTGL